MVSDIILFRHHCQTPRESLATKNFFFPGWGITATFQDTAEKLLLKNLLGNLKNTVVLYIYCGWGQH